eukprot:scaffold116850_cov31-Prasinocladus_malaysianus.AAC.1
MHKEVQAKAGLELQVVGAVPGGPAVCHHPYTEWCVVVSCLGWQPECVVLIAGWDLVGIGCAWSQASQPGPVNEAWKKTEIALSYSYFGISESEYRTQFFSA